jgi:hypothetical protein
VAGLVAGERGDGQQREGPGEGSGGERVGEPADGHVDEGERDGEQDQPGQCRQLPCRRCAGGHDGQGEPGGQLGQQRVRADPGAAAGQRPVTGSSARHRQRSGRISWLQAGHLWRGGWPDSVLRENTLARIRGPAITPTAAAAMIQGSVTVSPTSRPNASMRHNHSPGAGHADGGRTSRESAPDFSNEMLTVSAWAEWHSASRYRDG